MQGNRNNTFLKGTISITISVIVTKVLGVAFKVPLSYVLGDEGMGYFNTAYAIYGFFFVLCTAGVPKSITLVLSKYRANPEEEIKDEGILRCGLEMFAVIGMIFTLFNIICAPAIVRIIGNEKSLLSVLSIAPSLLFVSLSGVLRGYLNSNEKLTVIAVSQLIEAGIKLALGLLFSYLGVIKECRIYVIAALAILGITVGSAISFLYMYICVKNNKSNDNKGQNYRYCRKEIKKQIARKSFPIAFGASLVSLSSMLDLLIIIRRLISLGASADYANMIYGNYSTLALPMFNLVISVLSPLATAYLPRLSELHLSGSNKEYSKTLNRLLDITLTLSILASLCFYFFSFDLLDVLFSVQSSAIGFELLGILSFGVCLLSVLTVVNTALESIGKVKSAAASLVIGCIVKLVMSYLLIGNKAVGVFGAPIGSVASYFVSLVVSLYILGSSKIKTYTFTKIIAMLLIGYIAFNKVYESVYCTSIFGSSFVSMIASIFISSILFFAALIILYGAVLVIKMFKVHKNAS